MSTWLCRACASSLRRARRRRLRRGRRRSRRRRIRCRGRASRKFRRRGRPDAACGFFSESEGHASECDSPRSARCAGPAPPARPAARSRARRGDRLRPVRDDHPGESTSWRIAAFTARSLRRRARWSPRRGRGSSAACRARAPAGCAAAGRRRGWRPCRRSACASPSASPRSRRHRGEAGALLDPAPCRRGVEEGDVVGDRAGEELVVLHHRADHVAPGAQAELLDVDAADPDLARPAARGCRASASAGSSCRSPTARRSPPIRPARCEGSAAQHRALPASE